MSIGLWAQVAVLLMDCYIRLLGEVIYRLCIPGRAPVQRRLCPIFARNVGSPDIHECFRWLTSSQRTPGIWGVTPWTWPTLVHCALVSEALSGFESFGEIMSQRRIKCAHRAVRLILRES